MFCPPFLSLIFFLLSRHLLGTHCRYGYVRVTILPTGYVGELPRI